MQNQTHPIAMLEFLVNRISATSPLWLTVWVGSGILAIALIILMGTRWGQSKPMRKCAVLSLLAHVLLACAATTVRIVVHSGDTPDGSRVSVTVLSEGVPDPPQLVDDARDDREIEPWDPIQATSVIPPDVPPLPPSPPPDAIAPPQQLAANAIGEEPSATTTELGELPESTESDLSRRRPRTTRRIKRSLPHWLSPRKSL